MKLHIRGPETFPSSLFAVQWSGTQTHHLPLLSHVLVSMQRKPNHIKIKYTKCTIRMWVWTTAFFMFPVSLFLRSNCRSIYPLGKGMSHSDGIEFPSLHQCNVFSSHFFSINLWEHMCKSVSTSSFWFILQWLPESAFGISQIKILFSITLYLIFSILRVIK